MYKPSIKSPLALPTGYSAVILSMGLIFFFFNVSEGSTSAPDNKQPQTSISLPRYYCLANVASLGSGLVLSSGQSRTKSRSREMQRWTGWIRASASGRYEFSLQDSIGRVFVNQQQTFARSETSSKPVVMQIELLTNRFYAISVEMPRRGDSIVPLLWRRPDGRQEAVPKAYLYAPLETVSSTEQSVTS